MSERAEFNPEEQVEDQPGLEIKMQTGDLEAAKRYADLLVDQLAAGAKLTEDERAAYNGRGREGKGSVQEQMAAAFLKRMESFVKGETDIDAFRIGAEMLATERVERLAKAAERIKKQEILISGKKAA